MVEHVLPWVRSATTRRRSAAPPGAKDPSLWSHHTTTPHVRIRRVRDSQNKQVPRKTQAYQNCLAASGPASPEKGGTYKQTRTPGPTEKAQKIPQRLTLLLPSVRHCSPTRARHCLRA